METLYYAIIAGSIFGSMIGCIITILLVNVFGGD